MRLKKILMSYKKNLSSLKKHLDYDEIKQREIIDISGKLINDRMLLEIIKIRVKIL